MVYLSYTINKVDACLGETARLRHSDFPYNHSSEALESIDQLLQNHKAVLKTLSAGNNHKAVQSVCVSCLEDLNWILEYLGFILRSTNVRNAFEVYNPLLRLSRQVLGEKTKLILSSEWRLSPFIINTTQDLAGYVLIGLPASESSNPLLTPLAGHELGHAIWRNLVNINTKFQKIVDEMPVYIANNCLSDYQMHFGLTSVQPQDLAADMLHRLNWLPACECALKQAEESFCDFVGLRLFGTAYLHAFAYLLSPLSLPADENYPSLSLRATNIVTAAQQYGYAYPARYEDFFPSAPTSSSTPRSFLLDLAENVCANQVSDLIEEADKILESQQILKPSPKDISRIKEQYELYIAPCGGAESLANIINAGWNAFTDEVLWREFDKDRPNDILWKHGIDSRETRDRILKDLVLKSCEVFEVEQLLKGTDDSQS